VYIRPAARQVRFESWWRTFESRSSLSRRNEQVWPSLSNCLLYTSIRRAATVRITYKPFRIETTLFTVLWFHSIVFPREKTTTSVEIVRVSPSILFTLSSNRPQFVVSLTAFTMCTWDLLTSAFVYCSTQIYTHQDKERERRCSAGYQEISIFRGRRSPIFVRCTYFRIKRNEWIFCIH
jgi:hypothetical protein